MLKLRTVGAANRTHLTRTDSGVVKLYFRGLLYDAGDYVPNSLVGRQCISSDVTAGEFVCRQMLRDFGSREESWPALAKLFLEKRRMATDTSVRAPMCQDR